MKAIILAAGFATRLYPLTLNQAKPLLEIGGKPMLTWILEKLLQISAIDEVLVVGNERFRAQFEAWRRGVDPPIPVIILNDGSTTDDNKLGAIGDMAFAMNQIADDPETLIIAGDNLLEFDLRPHYEDFTRDRKPLLLLREIECTAARSRYNEVIVDQAGNVASFREKPPDPKSNLVAICLYFFPPGVKERIRQYLNEGNNPDAPGYFIQWLVGQMPVRAARFQGHWFDIGNLQTLEEARNRYGAATAS
ncbi:nucleotidyltransferase family protein [Candidatus Sumerlaeota bacterium]|nr:nucleotidyltransferase family protein [Candidatus Sumerlaeota bacterium]MBI3736559.1 nucleotidyltransferase family protein [Candidatus Sumerlaeota bacterium]